MDASYTPDSILGSGRDWAPSGSRNPTDQAWGSALPPPTSPVTPGQWALCLDTRTRSPVFWTWEGGLPARGRGSSQQAAGPAWPGSRGAERVKVCARPAGGRREGEQPGGKCEFLPVCLTAIKAAAPRSCHWAARLPGTPSRGCSLKWRREAARGRRRKGERPSPPPSAPRGSPAPRTWRRLPAAEARPLSSEDNLLTPGQVGLLPAVPLPTAALLGHEMQPQVHAWHPRAPRGSRYVTGAGLVGRGPDPPSVGAGGPLSS